VVDSLILAFGSYIFGHSSSIQSVDCGWWSVGFEDFDFGVWTFVEVRFRFWSVEISDLNGCIWI